MKWLVGDGITMGKSGPSTYCVSSVGWCLNFCDQAMYQRLRMGYYIRLCDLFVTDRCSLVVFTLGMCSVHLTLWCENIVSCECEWKVPPQNPDSARIRHAPRGSSFANTL